MNAGKALFSQLMDCLSWSAFARIVARYHGDHSVQTFLCTEQYTLFRREPENLWGR
jgi:hypothetical protein